MKKILTIILACTLLCSCFKQEYLYQINADDNAPICIQIFSNTLGAGYTITDETEINAIFDLFKKIKIDSKVECITNEDITFEVDYKDKIVNYNFDGGTVLIDYDKAYAVSDYEQLLDYINNGIIDRFELNVELLEVFSSNGLLVRQGKVEINQEDDCIVELSLENSSNCDYAIKLKPVVNGHKFASYQELGVFANSEIGYCVSIPSSVIKDFGSEKIGTVGYQIEMYELNSETYECGKLIDTGPFINAIEGEYVDKVEKNNIVFENQNMAVCAKKIDKTSYSCLEMYIENKLDKDIEVVFDNIELNGVAVDFDARVYTYKVKKNSDIFGLSPLSNYLYNEEKNELSIIPIKSLCIDASVICDDDMSQIKIIID